MTAATFSKLPDFEWGTNAACKSGQIHDEGDVAPIFTCKACSHKHCIECKRDWHPGFSCEDLRRELAKEESHAAERKRQEEEASEVEVQRVAKVSPQCGVNIQKSTGCDHMTCKLLSEHIDAALANVGILAGSRCAHEFCYLCRCSYRDIRSIGNHAHDQSCAHYRPLAVPTAEALRTDKLLRPAIHAGSPLPTLQARMRNIFAPTTPRSRYRRL